MSTMPQKLETNKEIDMIMAKVVKPMILGMPSRVEDDSLDIVLGLLLFEPQATIAAPPISLSRGNSI